MKNLDHKDFSLKKEAMIQDYFSFTSIEPTHNTEGITGKE